MFASETFWQRRQTWIFVHPNFYFVLECKHQEGVYCSDGQKKRVNIGMEIVATNQIIVSGSFIYYRTVGANGVKRFWLQNGEDR